jgi:hypothetical protein
MSQTIDVHPTDLPATDLPVAMINDVAAVLKVHGLDLAAVPGGQGLVELMIALGQVLNHIPTAYGGRASSRWVDSGSGAGYAVDSEPGSPEDDDEDGGRS